MPNLYETVKKIIHTETDEEAKNIFYSRDGVHVNNTEYIKNIISSFINKKEHIIRKEGNNLIFDLENYNDIWNIIFIGEYIKEHDILYKSYNILLEELKKIEDELFTIKNKHKNASSGDEHNKINAEYNTKNEEYKQKLNLLESFKKIQENFNNTEWVAFENANEKINNLENTKLLKQAINLLHKLRNSIEHSYTSYESTIKISNDGFNVKIPIDYINGFNAGRIISRDEDKIIVEKTNNISSPILKSLGYNAIEVESYFYNLNPEFLDYLLKIADYDINKLYQIPDFLLNDEYFIKQLVNQGLSIDEIINIPYEYGHNLFYSLLKLKSFANHAKTNKYEYIQSSLPHIIKLAKYCTKHNIHIEEIVGYQYVDNFISLIEKGISPDIVQILSSQSIKGKNSRYVDKEIKIIDSLIKAGINIKYNEFPECWIEDKELLLFYINEGYIKKEEFTLDNFMILREINDKQRVWLKYIKNNFLNLSQISLLMVYHTPVAMNLLQMGEDVNIINRFTSDEDFIDYHKSKNIYSYLLSRNFFVDKTNNHSGNIILDKTLHHTEEDIKNTLTDNQIISILDKLDNKEISYSLIYRIINTNEQKYEGIIKLIEILRTTKIDITKIRLEELIFNPLPYFDFFINIIDKNIHPKIIEILPKYYDDIGIAYFDEIYQLLNFLYGRCGNIDNQIPQKVITAYLQDKNDIPLVTFNEARKDKLNIKYENLSYLLDATNNDYTRLEEFPIEFFTCDIEILREMLVRYNSNINKSIFGIDNCKIISTLIYCNSVFSNYIKENKDFESINISPTDIINSCKNLTINYTDLDENNYFNQFIYNLDKENQSDDNTKRIILDKLRNSFAHFRFKPIKDENGNICSNKIILYDTTSDYKLRNFTIVFNLNDLIELTRSIEIDLEKKHSIDDISDRTR